MMVMMVARYFGNLHPNLSANSLQEVCGYFGEIEQVKIIKVGRAHAGLLFFQGLEHGFPPPPLKCPNSTPAQHHT